jgi:hypothetical protein
MDRPEEGAVVTVTLNEVGDKTEMISQLELPDHPSDDGVRDWFDIRVPDGWSDTIDRIVARFASATMRN